MNDAKFTIDLRNALEVATSQSLFESSRLGAITGANLKQLFDNQKWSNYISKVHEFSEVRIDNRALSLYTNKLENLFSKHLDPQSKKLGNGLFLLMGGSSRMAYPCLEEFAKILILGAAKIGADRVTELIVGWADGEPLRFQHCALLEGVNVEEQLGLEEEIELSKLPTSSVDLPATLPSWSGANLTDYLGGTVLSFACEAWPSLYRPDELDIASLSSMPKQEFVVAKGKLQNLSIDTFCDSMSLACNHYVHWQSSWRDLGELQAFSYMTGGASYKPKTMARNTNFTQNNLEKAKKIHNIRYPKKQSRASRRDIDLAISRWMNSKRSNSNEDRLIELRVALEALYGKGERAEKRFRISTYGAWHLGDTFEERREYYSILKKVYDDASQAIHAGKLKHTIADPKLLAAGQDLCRKGIIKRLAEVKEPSWDEMILGVPD